MFNPNYVPVENYEPDSVQEVMYSDEKRTRDRSGTNKPKIAKSVRDQRNKQRKAAQRRNRK